MKKTSKISLIILLCVICADSYAQNPIVVITTNLGDVAIELYPEKAPITVENFLQYVDSNFYNNIIFHRIMEGFMIQAGNIYAIGSTLYQRQTNPPIIGESGNGLKNFRGTIAMALVPGDPNSGTSGFFINLVYNSHLDTVHTVFGKVLTGMFTVDTIAAVTVGDLGFWGLTHFPYETLVYMERVERAQPGYWISTDLNNDGLVNLNDFAIAAQSTDMNQIAVMKATWLQTANWNRFTPADINNDGIVNLRDFAVYANEQNNPASNLQSDLSDNRSIDIFDLMLFTDSWLQTVP